MMEQVKEPVEQSASSRALGYMRARIYEGESHRDAAKATLEWVRVHGLLDSTADTFYVLGLLESSRHFEHRQRTRARLGLLPTEGPVHIDPQQPKLVVTKTLHKASGKALAVLSMTWNCGPSGMRQLKDMVRDDLIYVREFYYTNEVTNGQYRAFFDRLLTRVTRDNVCVERAVKPNDVLHDAQDSGIIPLDDDDPTD